MRRATEFLWAVSIACCGVTAFAGNATGSLGLVTLDHCTDLTDQGPGTTPQFPDLNSVYIKALTSGGGGLPKGSWTVQVSEPHTPNTLSAVGTVQVVGDGTPKGSAFSGGTGGCLNLIGVVGPISTSGNGEYKVSIQNTLDMQGSTTKTKNFRLSGTVINPDVGTINVYKFYDANVNGALDLGEDPSFAWKVALDASAPQITPTAFTGLGLSTYVVGELNPIGNDSALLSSSAAWVPTTFPITSGTYLSSAEVDLSGGSSKDLYFGNVCIASNSGGRTLGYWSNKNGQRDLQQVGYGIWSARLGSVVRPDGSRSSLSDYSDLRNWLLNGNAVNMAYMLSVQASALKLAVLKNYMPGWTMVYAPSVPSTTAGVTAAKFISVNDLLAYADALIASNSNTGSGVALRSEQEMLKNMIDDLNNNRARVAQATPAACGGAPAF